MVLKLKGGLSEDRWAKISHLLMMMSISGFNFNLDLSLNLNP